MFKSKKKQKQQQAEQTERNHKMRMLYEKHIKSEVRKQIEAELVKIKDQMTPPDIKVGDRVILDAFNLNDSGNSWDSGPGAIMYSLKEERNNRPIWAKVTKVSINESYADEKINVFIDANYDGIESWVNKKEVWYQYIKRGATTGKWGKYCGLYWNVHFELEDVKDFKPSWGLCSESFLVEGTDAAKDTERLWLMCADVFKKRKALQEIGDKKNQELNRLTNKYKK